MSEHSLTEHGTTDCPVEHVRANVDDGQCSACGSFVTPDERPMTAPDATTGDVAAVRAPHTVGEGGDQNGDGNFPETPAVSSDEARGGGDDLSRVRQKVGAGDATDQRGEAQVRVPVDRAREVRQAQLKPGDEATERVLAEVLTTEEREALSAAMWRHATGGGALVVERTVERIIAARANRAEQQVAAVEALIVEWQTASGDRRYYDNLRWGRAAARQLRAALAAPPTETTPGSDT